MRRWVRLSGFLHLGSLSRAHQGSGEKQGAAWRSVWFGRARGFALALVRPLKDQEGSAARCCRDLCCLSSSPACLLPGRPRADQAPLADSWEVGLRVKRLFKSHTSYEFGNPFPPGQVPLSRLEFPLDSWWAGVEARRNFPRWSIGLQALRQSVPRGHAGASRTRIGTTMNPPASRPSTPSRIAAWSPATT